MRLWLDPDRLTAFNLTPDDVVAAVQSQNMQAALGRIGAAPIAARPAGPAHDQDQGPAEPTPRSSQNIIVRANPDGSVVRVKDVARVELGAKTPDRYQPLQRRAGRRDRHLPVARRQRGPGGRPGPRKSWTS